MKKQYVFTYDYGKAEACFEVDLCKFTKKEALATLNFFSWDIDENEDEIDQVVAKYALEAIRIATVGDYNTYGVKSAFEKMEGFALVDGSIGIELTHVEGFTFDENDLESTSTLIK